MRIAFFTDTFAYINGVSTAVRQLSLGLSKLGHEVVIYTPNLVNRNEAQYIGSVKVEYISAITLEKIYPNFSAATPAVPYIFKSIKEFNPDIIHFHTQFILGWEALILGRILKKPVVGTFHTYFMEPEYLKVIRLDKFKRMANAVSTFLWKYNNLLYKGCDLVTTPSDFSRKDLVKHGINKEIEVLFNPMDFSIVRKVNEKTLESLRKKYWIGENVIIYVGRVSQEKSLPTLLLAFKKVLGLNPDAQLLIIGGGPSEKEVRELAIGLGIERSVIFMGEVLHSDLLQKGYFQLAKLFVTASTSEVQPMSFIEAMAFGLPIIAPKARGNTELVKDNGILFSRDNPRSLALAINKCLKSPQLIKDYSKSSEKLASNYSLDLVVKKLEKLYGKLS
jgi:1,2-diacylglycerol 3-alpha-glucosyltransferase